MKNDDYAAPIDDVSGKYRPADPGCSPMDRCCGTRSTKASRAGVRSLMAEWVSQLYLANIVRLCA